MGAYEIGVWAALRELEIKIHFVASTSVGALNAAMVAADDFLGAVLLWQNLTTDMVFDISVESSI